LLHICGCKTAAVLSTRVWVNYFSSTEHKTETRLESVSKIEEAAVKNWTLDERYRWRTWNLKILFVWAM